MKPRAILVAAVLLLAASARADKTEDALKLLDQGIAMFKANDLKAAHTVFTKVRDLMPDKANPYRWLGLVEARLGNCAEAVKDLEIFLGRVPAGDARTVEALTVHDACRDQLADKQGGLIVDSTPPGAEVRLDREDSPALGVTPYKSGDVRTGSHVLFVRLPKYVAVSKVFTVGPRETARLDVSLVPEPPPSDRVVAMPLVATGPVPEGQPPKSSKGLAIGLAGGGIVVVGGILGVGLGVGLQHGGGEPILPSVAGH